MSPGWLHGDSIRIRHTKAIHHKSDTEIGVFPKMEDKFSEFSEFKESDKSLKHKIFCLLPVSCWSLTQEGQVRIIVIFVAKFCKNIQRNLK